MTDKCDAAYPTSQENGWTKYEDLVKELYVKELANLSLSERENTVILRLVMERCKHQGELFFSEINR